MSPSQPVVKHSIAVVLFALIWAPAPQRGLASDGVTITPGEGKATVKIDGELFTEYVYQGHTKPILYPIIGPHGVEMTRHYPMKEDVDNEARDHPHQKSLWFTHGDVNGVNFWLEYVREGKDEQPGRIVQKAFSVVDNGFQTRNDWVAPNGNLVCTDSRKLGFGTTPAGRYIDYQIVIHASGGDVTFVDTKEGTMGLRTHPMLRLQTDEKRGNHTAAGQCVNSEGIEGREIWGKRAAWVDYWAPIDGKTVGIAIFDHPSNPRHPTWWHARYYGLVAANPFGIHDFEKKPEGTGDMLIESGQSVTFRYRFLFHAGDAKQANVKSEYARFASGRR